ncbi:DEAD/DEAH box helicase [Streptomyces sp. NPDC003401]
MNPEETRTMGIDWDAADTWYEMAPELFVEVRTTVHKTLGHNPAEPSESVVKNYRTLGRSPIWEYFGLRPIPDPETSGRFVADIFAEVATGRWDHYKNQSPTPQDNGARVAYYLYKNSTDARSGNPTADENLKEEMKDFFPDRAAKPNALYALISRGSFEKKGLSAEVEQELRAFSQAFHGTLADRSYAKGIAAPLQQGQPTSDAEVLLLELTPPPLAAAFAADMSTNLNPMQDWVLRHLKQVVDERSVMLITGPTGTGKSKIAQAALAFGARSGGMSAVDILPLKALVAQEFRTWERLRDKADLSWPIVAASRDFPEFDGLVSRGRFKVALAIYESIAAYLAAGAMPLSRSKLVVVDELQYLADPTRGVKLEMLLTVLRMLPVQRRPALVGLSATIQPNQSQALLDWLGRSVDEGMTSGTPAVAPACERPVPVDAYVVATRPDDQGKYTMLVQRDAHLIGSLTPPQDGPELFPHNLAENVEASYGDVRRPERFAAEVTRQLLKEDATRRVIIFVQSRGSAHQLAKALNSELARDDPARPSDQRRKPGKGNPWMAGRFANAQTQERAEDSLSRLKELTYKDKEAEDELTSWLRGGVAAHTARLLPNLRHQVEQEFCAEHSLLRVVVATDTLAVGLNAPADVVVLSRLTGYVGHHRKQALQSVAQVENKTGRAGRLGQGGQPRGRYYLITPSEEDLSGLPRPGERHVTTPQGVYGEYVAKPGRKAEVHSHLRSAHDMARLVLISYQLGLQTSPGQPHSPPTTDEFLRRIETLIDATLRKAEVDLEPYPAGDPDPLPTPEQVYDVLTEHHLLHIDHDYVDVNRLGMALARGSLPLSAASDLQSIATSAEEGASTLELLYEAADSAYIRETVQWVALSDQPWSGVIDQVTSYAAAYCSKPPRQPTASSQNTDRSLGIQLSARANQLPDATTISPDSRLGSLWAPGRNIRFKDVDALIRAIVAFEWARGEPFKAIRGRIKTITTRTDLAPAVNVAERKRRNRAISKARLELHAADVLQLVEQLAGFLAAAAGIVDAGRSRHEKLLLDNLAKTVGTGVPLHLVPLANLRIPTLQRERLVELAASVDPQDPGWENMPDLLDRLDVLVPEEDRQRVEQLYQERWWGSGHALRHTLLSPLGTTMPGADLVSNGEQVDESQLQTFDDWLEAAESYTTAEEHGAAWKDLLTLLGVKVGLPGVNCQQWGAAQPLRVRIPDGEVTGALDEIDEDLVICWRGMSDRASVLTSQGAAGSSRFVEPHQLLSRIAWAVHLHRLGRFPGQAMPDLLLDVLRTNADPRLVEVPTDQA